MTRRSLRWVLLGPTVLTLLIGAVALGVYVDRSVQADQIDNIDDELLRVANARRPPTNPTRPPPDGGAATGADPSNDELQAALDAAAPLELVVNADGSLRSVGTSGETLADDRLAELVGTSGVRTVDGDPRYRVATSTLPDGATQIVGLSLADVDASQAALRRSLLIGGIALILVQTVAVAAIARAVARPVTRMSRVAHRIADGELDTDVGPPEGPTETAALAEDLSRMLDRLRRTISAEEQSARDANRARADMQRFMADASHELRTPLTALKGYSDLFRSGMLDDAGVERAMQRIGSESERLHRLAAELLLLTGNDGDATDEPVDVGAVVSAVAHDLRAAHPDRTIDLDLDHGADLVVPGRSHRLHQAILNLGSNACHHTTGTVELTASAEPDAVEVRVVDHGDGIEPDHVAELFQPFARGDASRSRQTHDGAGLGLALVARIADRHHGTVTVDPTVGGGATFVLRLPRRR